MPSYIHTLRRFALIAGALPLVLGLLVMVSFAVTEASWLMLVGVLLIYFGLVSVALGAGALIWSVAAARKRNISRPAGILHSAWFAALVLLLNFPAAYACLYVGSMIATKYRVAVQNDTSGSLESARILGGGCDLRLGDIPPHETRNSTCWIGHDDSLRFLYGEHGQEHTVTIDGYVTNGMGGKRLVVVHADGSVEVPEGE